MALTNQRLIDIHTPYCSYCHTPLELFDHESSYDDTDATICYAHGTCPRCKRKYTWEDVYVFDHFQNVEEYDWVVHY